jgi:hypothetical protein
MVEKNKKPKKILKNTKKYPKIEEENKDRKYHNITEAQERAVIMRACGSKIEQISKALNKSKHTIFQWFKSPDVRQALEQENLDIIANQRDSYGQITEMAYSAIRENIQGDPSLAFAWLKETGHLPKSTDKAEKERVVEEILKRMQSSLIEG